MYASDLIRRNQGGSLYHFRIGPKILGTLRPGTCRGQARVQRKNGAGKRVGALASQTYSLKAFHAKTALLITGAIGTVGGCGAAAKVMVGAISALWTAPRRA